MVHGGHGRVGEGMIMTSFPIGLIAGMMAFIVLALSDHNSSLPSHCHFYLLNLFVKLVFFLIYLGRRFGKFYDNGLLSYIFFALKLLKSLLFFFGCKWWKEYLPPNFI